ncbi:MULTISPECIES: hypothetical protein [Clostridium]|uniref:hypothetical protein n=1 Tax=Clostridium TaxID=1485 RepID=UPI00069CF1C6|nr:MULTISPECIES: hypothetical protein [Clostridium]MCD2348979.1 hypothetical protein [Clostridium guangxiense]
MIENEKFRLALSQNGNVESLEVKGDPYKMNWVIDEAYLKEVGYTSLEKLFGHFDLTINGSTYTSMSVKPIICEIDEKIDVTFDFPKAVVYLEYDLGRDQLALNWNIRVKNKLNYKVRLENFGVWASFAYVMFRDKNVLRNIHNSAAVFPSISTNFTKINTVRRGNVGTNLGVYQTSGKTLSVGTYCEYQNLFFENVSPSLDGVVYHKLILSGGYPEDFNSRDWIYSKEQIELEANETKKWKYAIKPNESKDEFYENGFMLGHPKIKYVPLNVLGDSTRVEITSTVINPLVCAEIHYVEQNEEKEIDVSDKLKTFGNKSVLITRLLHLGEHKIVFKFEDGSEDFIVINVMDDLAKVIEERTKYICDTLYNGPDGEIPYAFQPISNQGESLGKLNLVLKKNLLGRLDLEQVRKVEASAVNYVRPKWFIDGNFKKPRKLYGEFYRCMDFEYIGHLFYLLSEFNGDVLQLNSPEIYLEWAADVFNLRVNPDLHKDERGKEEAQMLGVYFLYIRDLLEKLKAHGFVEKYNTIKRLWKNTTKRVNERSLNYASAITEHYFDNAGFGPAAGALSESGLKEGAMRYGELILANIGYSNDFRAQNPDRWWEALTYMIHSLWGGVTASAAFKVYEFLKDPEYLKASYRATAGILYCYDTHSTATLSLGKGMAGSTYAVAGPHINRPDLSRERFGQATFFRDGGIFARLFTNDDQTPDWDMGEELVAYLDGFGQKTFILVSYDEVEVINGTFEKNGSKLKVTSFAPYAKKFYLVKDGFTTELDNPAKETTITISL